MGRQRGSSEPDVVATAGDLVVERDPRRPSGRLLLQGEMEASYVDLADPTYLDFDYLRWIRVVLRVAGARRVLHVGGGACALARALAAEDPRGRQEVCESDARVLEVARAHLGLRRAPGLRVRHAEGRAFIADHPDGRWDAVVIDAFDGATVARPLITAEAFAAAARATPLALVNVVDNRAARDVRLIAAGMRTAFASVWTLGARAGNTVVVGSATPPDLALVAARAAADPSPARVTLPSTLEPLLLGTAALRDDDLRPASFSRPRA
ncbi:MAG TPA: fused MFS/spermidine synthase [Solirubrobacteraceae bacterium]|nr:fused MFS/spermidine synthase [Solirubrobacteraceae bacterium]